MTFGQFYRELYLPRHADPGCQLLHVIGVPLSVLYAGLVATAGEWWLLVFLPVPAYLLGWLGHLWIGNQPTFFSHPWLSFLGYWKMVGSLVSGRLGLGRPAPS